jgi:signal transduction histidine kinase
MNKYILSPGESRFSREQFLELLLRRMNHDFRTTLVASASILGEINEFPDDEQYRIEAVPKVLAGVGHVQKITSALQTFAFWSLPYNMQLGSLLDDLKNSTNSKCDMDVVVDCSEIKAYNYSQLLYTQLWNFVSNAHSNGARNISVFAEQYGATEQDIMALGVNSLLYLVGDPFVRVSVADDACGIAPERLESIFESGVSGRGSSGIGLALCEDTCRLIHGYATVESKVGDGSTFSLHFPQYRKS